MTESLEFVLDVFTVNYVPHESNLHHLISVSVHVQLPSATILLTGYVHHRRLVQRALIAFLQELVLADRLPDGFSPYVWDVSFVCSRFALMFFFSLSCACGLVSDYLMGSILFSWCI